MQRIPAAIIGGLADFRHTIGQCLAGFACQQIQQLIARRPDLRLLTARDGNLGIQRARTSQPEVILMDINLPGISGIEALKNSE